MKVAGIIAEYNPLHNGHIYHLNKTKEITMADFIVVCMSGNFAQRGEATIADKWARGHMAVESGVDLVLELPFIYACNSAEFFARGAVNLLDGLGCVDFLSFGSESGNIEEIKNISNILTTEPKEYKEALKKNLDKGFSFPKARELAIRDLGENHEILREPNNILAIEYLKAIQMDKLDIKPVTVKRKGDYNDSNFTGEISSAKAIRQGIREGTNIKEAMPEAVYNILTNEKKNIELLPFLQMQSLTESDLTNIFSAVEGIENKLIKNIRKFNTFEDLSLSLKSKRYTQTAINRFLIHVLLGLKKETLPKNTYARVLAFNEKGAKLLKHIKKQEGRTQVITNINKEINKSPFLKYDILATDLYNLSCGRNLYEFSDYVKKPFIK